jgi:hypothetical protein
MATPAPPQTRQCVACGKSMMWEANVCPYCGKDYRQPAPGMMPMAPVAKPKSVVPIIAGIFSIITALLGLATAAFLALSATYLNSLLGTSGLGIDIGGIVMVMVLIGVLISVVVLISGIFAVMRKHFGFAIVGAVLAMILIGPFTFWAYFIGVGFGFLSLILLAVAHKEFN